MANDIKLQEGHPVDENIRPLKVGGKATAIETAQSGNGAKVTGDLEVTGDIRGNIKDMVLEDVTLDSLTTNSIVSTDLTIDDSGDITLDADGDNITMKAGSDGSGLDFIQSGTGDYTIKNLTSDKDVIFNVNDDGADTEVMRLDGSASSLLFPSGKKIEFTSFRNYITSDANDLSIQCFRNLNLTADNGDVVIDAGGANITLQDDGGEYTPSADSDAATKKYVDDNAGGTMHHYMQHQWYNTGTADYYIPFGASTVESSGTSSSLYDDTFWIAPFSGKLIKAYMLFDYAPGVCDFKMRQGTTGANGSLRASLMSGGTVDCSSAGVVYTFTCDQNNTFSAGEVINLQLDITAKTDQGLVTTIWEID